MKLLTKEQQNSYQNAKICHICKENHHQLQEALDVGLATQALVPTCVSIYNKAIICCRMYQTAWQHKHLSTRVLRHITKLSSNAGPTLLYVKSRLRTSACVSQQASSVSCSFLWLCKEKLKNKYLKDKKYCSVRDHRHFAREYRGAAHSICNLKFSVPKKVSMAFHNESYYNYHFIIKELAKKFKKQFTCLGENTEKYITLKVPIEKEVTRIN